MDRRPVGGKLTAPQRPLKAGPHTRYRYALAQLAEDVKSSVQVTQVPDFIT